MTPTIVVLAIIVLIAVWFIILYNNLIRYLNRAKEAWSDIDVQLKRRYDLIPNLINTVKGYAEHESSVFENVTKARATAMSSSSNVNEKGHAEAGLVAALKSVFAIAEAYPDLKANQNFLELQKELADTENKIQASRRFYNANVRDLNTSIESFPTNFLARMFRFTSLEFFDLEDSTEREPVIAQF